MAMVVLKRLSKTMWLSAAVVLLLGCGAVSDYEHVDFSQKTEVAVPIETPGEKPFLKVAVAAMISPKETFIYYRELIDYLGSQLGHRVELIQRKTYGEVNELLARGRIDFAFICTGPFVAGNARFGFEAVATPIVRGQPYYQSYLIVHRESVASNLMDLKGKDFAFTDPDSNTGSLVPRYWLRQMGFQPENFFNSFTYTYSHDNAIIAVAKKLVDAAAIDGHMWEYYQQRNPFYSAKTRVIKKSAPFGSPPIVVSASMDQALKEKLVNSILTMHNYIEGKKILSELMIDRFAKPKKEWYLSVKEMMPKIGVPGKT